MQILNLPIVLFAMVTLAPTQILGQSTDMNILKTMKDGEPVVIDEYRREPGRLIVSTESVGRARFEIEAELAEDEAVSKAHIRVWPEGQKEPEMDVTAEIIGNFIFWGHSRQEPGTMEVPAGTLIYVPPSATAMEQAVRHAVAVRDGREIVPLTFWSPYQITEVQNAEVRFTEPGTAELAIFGATYTLSIDGEGNILEGRVDPQGNTIVRE